MTKGQVIVVFPTALIVVLAVATLVIDGGLYMVGWRSVQEALDAACLAAAGPGDDYGAFKNSLYANGVASEFYQPYVVGVRGIQYTQDGFRAWLTGPQPTYLAQFMGLRDWTLHVRTRCIVPALHLTPILVKEPWLDNQPWPILGQEGPGEAQCDTCQGADFTGAGLPWVTSSNQTFEPRYYTDPATPNNSPNVFKSLFRDAILGTIRTPLLTTGTRIPVLAGVSNKFVVSAMLDAGYKVGDRIIVLVFNGEITDTEPWENTQILYFAVFEITAFDQNTMHAAFIEAIPDAAQVNQVTRIRTVPFDWSK